MDFLKQYHTVNWQSIQKDILSKSRQDVEKALKNQGKGDLNDFMALLSPVAENYLEEMAFISQSLTKKRFGNTVQLYIPLYLSNSCTNNCLYCGFKKENTIERITLNSEEILKEVKVIKSLGFDHILLVTGEDNKKSGVDYLLDVIKLIRPYFSQISIEVQPLETEQYKNLIKSGLSTVLVYQETYNQQAYKKYHLSGKKTDFNYRLLTADRLGKAEIYKIGLGCLLGLEDWRADSWFTAFHLQHLEKKFWKTKFSISFPRLRPATGVIETHSDVSDKNLLQLICAYRIFNENVELSLSTRESKEFRDNVIKLGITTISAGSKTEPGGYTKKTNFSNQFEISDDRSPNEIVTMIKSIGYESIWKDWEFYF